LHSLAVSARVDLYSDASTLHMASSLDGCGYNASGCWASCGAGDAWGLVYNASAAHPAASYEDLAGVDVLSFGSWTAAWAPVAAVFPANASLITARPLSSAPPGAMGGPCTSGGRYVLHNVAEALAAGSGAAYFSDAENAVYYAPLASEGAAFEAVVPVLPSVVRVQGADCGGPLSLLELRGLNISYTTEAAPRAESYFAPRGALELSSAAHVLVANVSVAHAGGSGVQLLGRLVDVTIDSSDVRDVGGDGIGCDVGASSGDLRTTLTNNVVEGTGHIFLAQPSGIRVTGASDSTLTVAHNLVRDSSYSCIAVGWSAGTARPPPGAGYQFIVDSNIVADCGQGTLNDFGGIYLSTNGYACEATETCFMPSLVTNNIVTNAYGYADAGSVSTQRAQPPFYPLLLALSHPAPLSLPLLSLPHPTPLSAHCRECTRTRTWRAFSR